jgi:hypothetical protein
MGWSIQDNNADAKVEVREGFHRDSGAVITEFIIADKAANEHRHLGINEKGDEVFNHVTKH